jgi:hypothetical protein
MTIANPHIRHERRIYAMLTKEQFAHVLELATRHDETFSAAIRRIITTDMRDASCTRTASSDEDAA